MLHVFLVDTGCMLAFEMSLALETVSQLKEVIERHYKIPSDKQVLLISGGESLDSTARVFSYSAGTDTNPIFLFSKSTIESAVPPSPSIDLGSDADLEEQVEGALGLPPTYTTVVARCHLAQQFHDIARDQAQACERLVHEQHLQQQGWAAVVANLEDITSAFRTKAELFEINFQAYLESREQYVEVLNDFTSDLELLGRIPVLQALLKSNKGQLEIENSEKHSITLHQWISSKDHHNSLEMVAEQCRRGLEQFENNAYRALQADISKTVESVNNASMKEIKGLEERLYGLDQLMQEARRIVKEQAELAQAFMQNKMRAANVGDMSVYPDLCASHKGQLKVMLKNHQQLRDIHRRCVKAKEELSINLHARLRWIMYVERAILEIDSKLVIYHENLKRLKRHLEVAQQIHLAPTIYLTSVVEVVRRRAFSKEFLKWSKVLSHQAAYLHKREMCARREFTSRVSNHFLYSLFPGMNDAPPPYALETPAEFDAELPDIQFSDIETLKALLPDMAASLNIPEVGELPDATPGDALMHHPSTHLVISRPNSEPLSGRECFLSAMADVQAEETQKGLAATAALPDNPLESPREERDPEESEPDTEEFEKVESGAAGEVKEDETSQSRQHLHELEERLRHVQLLENDAVLVLRRDVNEARHSILQTRDDFVSYLVTLSSQVADVISLVQERVDSDKERVLCEMLSKAQSEHQVALEKINQQLELESRKLNDAYQEIQKSQEQLQRNNDLVETIRQEGLAQLTKQKESLLADHHEIVKKMTLEHELELESLKEEHQKEFNKLEYLLKESLENLTSKTEEMDNLRDTFAHQEDRFSERLKDEIDRMANKLQEEFFAREQAAIAKVLEDARQNWEEETKRIREERSREISEEWKEREERLTADLSREFEEKCEQQLKDLRESLAKEHRHEMEGLRARFRLAFNTAGMERSPSDSSLEKIERPDSADPSRIEQQVSTLKAELEEKEASIAEMKAKHQKELDDLWRKAKRDSLKLMETSRTAEKQVAFNEAVNKATTEKENIIQDLQLQLKHIREELEEERLLNSRIKQKEESFTFSLTSDRSESSPVLSRPDSGTFHMVSPITPRRSESSGLLGASVVVSPSSEQLPDSENMDVSLTASAMAMVQPDKVSVYTCNVGDLVLFFYDEKHENYMVFSAISTYHFLNHDCLDLLSLSPSASGEIKSYIIAQITEKEYCQARKEQNRFRVPLGTRFYRVRAKPAPENPLRRSQSSAARKKLSLPSGSGSL